jgi:hypothetical protein
VAVVALALLAGTMSRHLGGPASVPPAPSAPSALVEARPDAAAASAADVGSSPPAAPIAPAPVQHRLAVTSRPVGAIVREDGAELGTTPLTLPVAHGASRTLELELGGYERARISATEVTRDDELEVALKKRPPPRPAPAPRAAIKTDRGSPPPPSEIKIDR